MSFNDCVFVSPPPLPPPCPAPLQHAGVIFAPAYQPHRVPLRYDGKPVVLTAEQEEVASFYAAIPEDGPQLGNPKTREIFQNNFFADFKKLLPAGEMMSSS